MLMCKTFGIVNWPLITDHLQSLLNLENATKSNTDVNAVAVPNRATTLADADIQTVASAAKEDLGCESDSVIHK